VKSIALQVNLYFLPFLMAYPFNFYNLDHYQSIRVIDGDSLVLYFRNREERIRLAFIDAPEMKQIVKGKDFGEKAKSLLIKLVEDCSRLNFQVIDRDRYSRLIAEVKCYNKSLNFEMVRQGFAKLYYWSVFRSVEQKELYKKTYKHAKKEKIGLMKYKWDPYKFRKKKAKASR